MHLRQRRAAASLRLETVQSKRVKCAENHLSAHWHDCFMQLPNLPSSEAAVTVFSPHGGERKHVLTPLPSATLTPTEQHDKDPDGLSHLNGQLDAGEPAGRDPVEVLPESLVLKIFQKVPPRVVASKCAFISTAWAAVVRSSDLWESYCSPWGLTANDASLVLGGWRGLYALVFATNMVQCPNFERIHHSDPPAPSLSPFKATSTLVVERITDMDEVEPEYSASSYWEVDGETSQGIFQMGGINSLCRTKVSGLHQQLPQGQAKMAACSCCRDRDQGHGQEDSEAMIASGSSTTLQMPVLLAGEEAHSTVQETGGNPISTCCTAPAVGLDAVCTSDCTWGCLKQSISLKSFPGSFLDQSPTIQLSAWCASKSPASVDSPKLAGTFQMKLLLLGENEQPIYCWDSLKVNCKDNKWRQASVVVKDYPPGARTMVVKVAGKGAHFTQIRAAFNASQINTASAAACTS